MSREEIRDAVRAFGDGASRAVRVDFDGVQIQAGHGFLLSQFLSPWFNHRSDEYGGSLENRARILLEVVEAVRQAVGVETPVLVKINATDFLKGGFQTGEMIRVASMLEKAGVDAIEVSGGSRYGFDVPNPDVTFSPVTRGGAYYEQAARACKQSVSIPVMLVGGIRSLAVSQRLVQDGITDYLSLCRPLIREPDLIRRWKSGDARDSECLSDDSCFQPGFDGKGVYCVHTKGHREKAGLLRFFSGSTGAVNTRRAVDECLENALGDEDTDCDLLIFYTTMGHAFREILSQARSRCPMPRIVGTSCAGVIGREGPNESMRALAVMAVRVRRKRSPWPVSNPS